MTLKEAKAEVKQYGFTLRYDAGLGEYSVYDVWYPANTYYTDNREDAVSTAFYMMEEKRRLDKV